MKWFFAALAFLFVGGAMWLASLGVGPRPVRKINPTVFERLDQVGIVTYRRLWGELNTVKAVVLVGPPLGLLNSDVWTGFIKAAKFEGFNPQMVFQDPLTPLNIPGIPSQVFKSASESVRWIGSHIDPLSPKKSGVIFSLSEDDPELIKSISEEMGAEPLVIRSLPFAVSRNEEDELDKACKIMNRNPCPSLHFSRRYYRKKLSPQKIVAGLEQHSLNEYLLFLSHPNN